MLSSWAAASDRSVILWCAKKLVAVIGPDLVAERRRHLIGRIGTRIRGGPMVASACS